MRGTQLVEYAGKQSAQELNLQARRRISSLFNALMLVRKNESVSTGMILLCLESLCKSLSKNNTLNLLR